MSIDRRTADAKLRDHDSERMMDAATIIRELTPVGPLPRDALAAAGEHKDELIPRFVDAVEAYVERPDIEAAGNSIFFMFHLLGEWRATPAYPTLARFMRSPVVEATLDDAVTENGGRVLASVFDGDPRALFDIVLDHDAYEFSRHAALNALSILTALGRLPRDTMRAFLERCHADLRPEPAAPVWPAWACAVCDLGFAELAPLAEEAFARGYIEKLFMTIENFREGLAEAEADPSLAKWLSRKHHQLFGAACEELAQWHCFTEEFLSEQARTAPSDDAWIWNEPHINLFRDVGRNDPCPCGSGRKYKTCCLN